MKINQLSMLISAAMLCTTAHAAEIYNKDGNKLDLYGLVSAEHYFSNSSNNDGDQTYMRLGFRGETQVNEQITGYGQWQMHIDATKSEGESNNPRTRYAFAGLKFADYGSIDYGRNKGVVYDSLAYTDMQPEFDGMTYGSDQFLFSRTNGVLTYRNTDFFGLVDGLNVALQYQGKNDGGGEPGVRDVLRQNGDGFGASVTYDIGAGFSVAGSMMSSDRTNEQNTAAGIMGRGKRAEAYSGAIKYDANNVYLAAMFTQAYNASRFGSRSSDSAYGYANKSQIMEFYAGYLFDFGLQPFVAYDVLKGKNLGRAVSGNTYGDEDLIKYVDFGATYNFNKNINVFVDYMVNLVDEDRFTREAGINTDDVVAVGVVYQF
ncbi:porin OmpC [Leclercia pneumoniae]|uniref:Porin OmpC n=1 Tax=Leclercia pneumoniae TaxID=2815358 RepID=A0ABX8K0F4_9ENTR|nr:porin OmpC [Leclercia pneumoniae]QSW33619.1 porin OmpC [Leclercia pneumoniae]QWW81455.1 porin OmpC [Leclercia pneumoniae]